MTENDHAETKGASNGGEGRGSCCDCSPSHGKGAAGWLQLLALLLIAGLLVPVARSTCDGCKDSGPKATPEKGLATDWVEKDLELARAAVAEGDYGRAEAALNEAQALAPDSTDVRLERYRAVVQRIATQTGAIQDAEEAAVHHGLDILEWKDGRSPALMVARGHLSMKRGDLDGASARFEEALVLDPAHVLAYLGKASLARARNKPLEAIGAFEKAVEASPENLTALNNLGVQYVEMGRPADGTKMFERALKVRDNAATRLNLGDALAGERRIAEAIEHVRKAAELAPSSAGVHRRLGVLLQAADKLQEAEEALLRSLGLEQNAATLFSLGTVYQAQRRMDRALDAFQRILRADPSHVASLFELARTLEAMHQTEHALAAYQKLLEVAGNAQGQLERVTAAREAIARLSPKPAPTPAPPEGRKPEEPRKREEP